MWQRTWWSSDGQLLYYNRGPVAAGAIDDRSEIWGCPASGGEPVLVASLNGNLVLAGFHPDGAQIAYVVRSTRLETYLLENFLPASPKARPKLPAAMRR